MDESLIILKGLHKTYPDNESVLKQLLLTQQAHENLTKIRTKVLVVSNCASRAYVGYLKIAFPDWDVRLVFQSLADSFLETADQEFNSFLSNLDIAIGFTDSEPFTSLFPKKTLRIKFPPFIFFGYHPDVVFVSNTKSVLENGNSHSKIAINSFFGGKSLKEAEELYNYEHYKKQGYFDHFEEEREKLLTLYSNDNLDISDLFDKWNKDNDFMHYPVHPNSKIFYDVLHRALSNQGYESVLTTKELATKRMSFDDYFKGSVIWPVYPEIASVFGVMVKPMRWTTCHVLGKGETFGLKEMLTRSWKIFEQSPDRFKDYVVSLDD